MVNSKVQILGTGLTGLVGSRIVELLKDYDFKNVSRETGTDLTDKEAVFRAVEGYKGDWILHLAAKSDVDGCEGDRGEDIKILGYSDIEKKLTQLGKEEIEKINRNANCFKGKNSAWAVNVIGTLNLSLACKEYGKKLLAISTDFVFDGEKEKYSEDDETNAINWYGKTKEFAEKIVSAMVPNFIIARIAYPYRANFSKKNDFVRAILARIRSGNEMLAIEDQIITPTYIDDIALGVDLLLKNGQNGIYHLVGSNSYTPCQAIELIAKTFGLSLGNIKKVKKMDFYRDRARRPFKLRLSNDKIVTLGLTPRDLYNGLIAIKSQLRGGI